MGRIGIYIEQKVDLTLRGSKYRVFDRPDQMAQVYNQLLRELLCEISKNNDQNFGKTCLSYSTELEFQAHNTPHHHGVSWLDCVEI